MIKYVKRYKWCNLYNFLKGPWQFNLVTGHSVWESRKRQHSGKPVRIRELSRNMAKNKSDDEDIYDSDYFITINRSAANHECPS